MKTVVRWDTVIPRNDKVILDSVEFSVWLSDTPPLPSPHEHQNMLPFSERFEVINELEVQIPVHTQVCVGGPEQNWAEWVNSQTYIWSFQIDIENFYFWNK